MQPYLKFRQREMLFREGILNYIGLGQAGQQHNDDDEYQAALKMQATLAGGLKDGVD